MTHPRVRSSPYLVLGVDFGATPAEANRAFARRTKELDRAELPFSPEDLNWAQSLFKRPEELRFSLEFLRVPIGAAKPPEVPEGALFRPAPERMGRRTPPVSDERRAELESDAAKQIILRLLIELEPVPHDPYVTRRPGRAV